MSTTEILTTAARILLVTAGISATAIPVLYAFSKWNTSWLGRALMYQACAVAFAVDVNIMFRFVRFGNLDLRLWIGVLAYLVVTVAFTNFAVMMFRYNYYRTKKETS